MPGRRYSAKFLNAFILLIETFQDIVGHRLQIVVDRSQPIASLAKVHQRGAVSRELIAFI